MHEDAADDPLGESGQITQGHRQQKHVTNHIKSLRQMEEGKEKGDKTRGDMDVLKIPHEGVKK